MKCPNCSNPEMAVLYERKCYECGYHQDTADRKAIRAMLEALEGCFVMGHRENAICFSCYAIWPNHVDDCKLAAAIKQGKAVVG